MAEIMLVKFLTALAWLWGAVAVVGTMVQLIPPISERNAKASVEAFLCGVPAWAWLIARYLL